MSRHHHHSALATGLILASALTVPLPAQWNSTLDVSTSRTSRTNRLTLPEATVQLTPRVSFERGGRFFDGMTTLETGGGALERGTLNLVGGVRPLMTAPWFGVALNTAGRSNHEGSLPTRTRLDARLELRAEGEHFGAFASVGPGRAWHGVYARNYTTGGVGGWLALGNARLEVSWELLSAGSASAAGQPTASNLNPALRALNLADARAQLSWSLGWAELSGFAAQRVGYTGGSASRWGGLAASVPVAGSVSLIGRYEYEPFDPLLHQAARQTTSLGVRLGAGSRRTQAVEAAAGVARSAVVVPDAFGRMVLQVNVARASRVELLASYTDWLAIPLEPTGPGRWTTMAPLPSGLIRLLVRVDGGPWQIPANLRRETDEFLGAVGLLTVDDSPLAATP